MKHYRNDPLDVTQHLLLDLVDVVQRATFFAGISANRAAGKDFKNILKKAPKQIPRPVIHTAREQKVKKVFTKPSKLMGGFSTMKVRIDHTPECVKSGVNSTGELNCSCPPRIVDKKKD